ncbi:three-helix bundle dimerization domain-containing protein [Cellulosimicrobium sp. NPDC055967]|uniref:three-helix bundle dimerization domain-containing protein n=1 Tax=Cellulosimicrobium sp. NPDC055967 TaxID=3345670 RepID=UPI0035E2D360
MAMEDEDREIDVVVERISARFPEVPVDDVREQVLAELGRYQTPHVRDFVPVLVENAVSDVLRSCNRPPRPARRTPRPDR